MARGDLDVAIVGGGMAGNLLARQLSRTLPDLRVAVFDRKTHYSNNVGESMVEIASNYFVRRLGLSSYLYDRQYPKNGLRFFFDSAERNVPLEQMSEIGSASLPFFPAFQIDRSRLETDLIEMNRMQGIQVHLGARVEEIALGEGGGLHRLVVSEDGGSQTLEARWVVDASGRSRLLARQLDLHVPETTLANASAWGWFEGVADIDALGPEAFRARVRHAPRRLSTLHFLYPGYWIWFIPLRAGLTSVGVVCEGAVWAPAMLGREGLLAFLRRHAAVATLLHDAKPVDVAGMGHLSYGTRRFFGNDRWALV
ncbi:MAG: tryptophan 7-halogenase, partial [Deltaproteobacteria bacterium]|nr:tryptophan 7-halogenase [Deltaproteobacteria bacterium]